MTPEISIIIVYRTAGMNLEDCLRSIHVATSRTVEVIVVDLTPQRFAKTIFERSGFGGAHLPESEKLDRAAGLNIGARYAEGKYLCFLTPDSILQAHALDRLMEWVEQRPRVIAGPKEVDEDNVPVQTVQPLVSRRVLLGANELANYNWPRKVQPWMSWLVPALQFTELIHDAREPKSVPSLHGAMLMTKAAWQEIGEFDEQLGGFGYTSDWFSRAKDLGYVAQYVPEATLSRMEVEEMPLLPADITSAEAKRSRWHLAKRFGWVTVALLAISFFVEAVFRRRQRPS